MTTFFQTTLATGAIVVYNMDNLIFCTLIPKIAKNNKKQEYACYDDECGHSYK
jgi:hypothetical protein